MQTDKPGRPTLLSCIIDMLLENIDWYRPKSRLNELANTKETTTRIISGLQGVTLLVPPYL